MSYQVIKSTMHILQCYLQISYRGMFFNNFYPPGQKLPRRLYMGYQLCCACITMLFAHKLPGKCFSTTFFCPGQNVTAAYVHRLSGLQCLYYHGIYTFVTKQVCLQQISSLGQKLMRCLYMSHKLYYACIFMLFLHKLSPRRTARGLVVVHHGDEK